MPRLVGLTDRPATALGRLPPGELTDPSRSAAISACPLGASCQSWRQSKRNLSVRSHFIVVQGSYQPENPACPKCGQEWIRCYPGEYPKCENCRVTFLTMGRTPKADCVTPSGRIDAHMKYVRIKDQVMTCSFCGKGSVNLGPPVPLKTR